MPRTDLPTWGLGLCLGLSLATGCQPLTLTSLLADQKTNSAAQANDTSPKPAPASAQSHSLANPGQTGQQSTSQLSLADRAGSSSTSQALAASELSAQPQSSSITAPPQGITAPPLGFSQPLNQSQFDYFDQDKDHYWNRSELQAYTTEWQAQNQTAEAQSFSTKALGVKLDLDLNSLMQQYDKDQSGLLDFEEAQALHLGLGEMLQKLLKGLGSVVSSPSSAVGGLLNPVSETLNQATETLQGQTQALGESTQEILNESLPEAVSDSLQDTSELVGQVLGQPAPEPSPAAEQESGASTGLVEGLLKKTKKLL